MPTLNWHDYLVLISLFASIAGLFLLSDDKQAQEDELESAEQTLLRMTFGYWMAYCISFSLLKVGLPEWSNLIISLKLTAIFSYFLTFTCILSLPLHRMSVRQVE